MGTASPASGVGRGTVNPYTANNPAGGGYGVQQTAGAEGYATGPYDTGRGPAGTAPTQQGFYSPTYSANGGPVASTADVRAGAYPNAGSGYGAVPAANGYPSPATYGGALPGSTPGYAAQPAAGYGTPNTASGGYGAAGPSYPAMPPTGDYPSAAPMNSYPATPAGAAAYPNTNADSYSAPVTTPGGYPSSYNSVPATGYGPTSSDYAVPGGYAPPTGYAAGAYPQGTSGYGADTAGGLESGYGATGYGTTTTATSAGSGYSTGDQSYRPGSTGRNSDVLGSGGGYATPPSDSPYQGTYSR